MTTTFNAATSVVPRGDDAAGRGRYDVELVDEYSIMGSKPNGGYMLACLGRAALDAARVAGSTHEHVISASAQFLSSPGLGPAQIVTEIDRVGKTASQVNAMIGVDGVRGVRAQFTLGTLHEGTAPFWGEIAPCPFPPLEDSVPSASPMAGERGVSLRFDPDAGFRMTPDGPVAVGGGEFRAYLCDDVDGRFDTVGLLYAADVMPPATFGVVQTGWVPTLAITVYNRAVPAPGPLRLRFRVQVIHDGYADEICEAWDSEDRLVMQSTQMTALRIPADAGS
jgi:Acyl-CoA thioesterase C-terminal domain/Acyl-CoA thioesterase N-terminal domain